MENTDKGQVNTSAAEIYEEFFIPALFEEWPERVMDVAHIQTGQRVLDVACGTGVLTRSLAKRVGSTGSEIGLDINVGMLAVAKCKAPQIEWRQGQAVNLPFNDAEFDAVVSQFGLMFFEDRQAAIREMSRVLKLGGNLAVAVWDSLDHTPGYAAMVGLLQKLFGDAVANGLRAPYILGETEQLQVLFNMNSLSNVVIKTYEGTARFPSIEAWVYTDIKGWVLADTLDEQQIELLLKEAKHDLAQFVTADGSVVFKAPAHIVSAQKS